MGFSGTIQCSKEEMRLSQEAWRELTLLCSLQYKSTKNYQPFLLAGAGLLPWKWAKEAYWRFDKQFSWREGNE